MVIVYVKKSKPAKVVATYSLTGNPKALASIIEHQIENSPEEFDGHQWAALPQEALAKQMGLSVATIRRIIAKPPFVRRRRKIEGKVTVLLRIGEEGSMTPRHIANIMSRRWREHLLARREIWEQEKKDLLAQFAGLGDVDKAKAEKRLEKLKTLLTRPNGTTTKEYGLIFGLVENWPEGHQIEFLTMVLKRWPEFMVGVKIAAVEETGVEDAFSAFLEAPALSVIRRFYKVALEMALMDAQKKGQMPEWV